MTTRTSPRKTSHAGQSGRFARRRSPSRPKRVPAGRAVPKPRRFGRQPPKQSAARQTIERVIGQLRRSRPKASRRPGGAAGKRTAGLAAFAGAAALALKNRDRLKALVADGGDSSTPQSTAGVHPPAVAPGDAEPATVS